MIAAKPARVVAIHRSMCERAGCTAVVDYGDPCTGCPNGHYGAYMRRGCEDGLRLGDKVAYVAQPIARTIDRMFGTNLRNCGGCKKRQRQLNQLSV